MDGLLIEREIIWWHFLVKLSYELNSRTFNLCSSIIVYCYYFLELEIANNFMSHPRLLYLWLVSLIIPIIIVYRTVAILNIIQGGTNNSTSVLFREIAYHAYLNIIVCIKVLCSKRTINANFIQVRTFWWRQMDQLISLLYIYLLISLL